MGPLVPFMPSLPFSLFMLLGKLSSMKCKQEGIDVAKKEMECGLTFQKFSDFQEGDKIQSFITNQLRQEISWNWGF